MFFKTVIGLVGTERDAVGDVARNKILPIEQDTKFLCTKNSQFPRNVPV